MDHDFIDLLILFKINIENKRIGIIKSKLSKKPPKIISKKIPKNMINSLTKNIIVSIKDSNSISI